MEIRPQTGKIRIAYPTLVAAGTLAAAVAFASCDREPRPLGGIAPQPLGGEILVEPVPPEGPDATTAPEPTKPDAGAVPQRLGGKPEVPAN